MDGAISDLEIRLPAGTGRQPRAIWERLRD